MIRQNAGAKQSITSKSAEETQKIAERLAKRYAGNLICLYGELGSGKTTFVRGFANGLKIKSRIQSPTFTYSRVHKGIRKLYHFDCYRICAERNGARFKEKFLIMEILEALEHRDGIVIIEWPQYIINYLPKKRMDIYLDHINPNTRNIKIILRRAEARPAPNWCWARLSNQCARRAQPSDD